ncbi:hypothetical protein KY366_04905 [Candidatus Woesearchaeota archaeon]|nr:hypothetical protein [Candidatus Woesearchaeota archaeon]
MAYIRVKKIRIKGREYRYAYLVENRWKKRVRKGSKKGARQKVKGYLGKVHEFPKVDEKGFMSHFGVKDVKGYFDAHKVSKVIRDLVRVELMNYGFAENGDFYSNGDLVVYVSDKDFFIRNLKEEKERKIVIVMNEGFLCRETFSRLVNFKGKGDEKEIGLSLGNALLEAGLKVPKEVFVEMVERFAGK